MDALLLSAVLVCSAAPAVPAATVTLETTPNVAKGLVTPVYRWSDSTVKPKAAIMLIHGFPQHGKLYDGLARELVKQGFIVYAPDMRGLGRAWFSGTATELDYVKSGDNDLKLLALAIRKEHPGLKLFVGGESMGGAYSIRLAALQPGLVDGIILSGAAIKLEHHYAGLIPQGIRNILFGRKVDFSNQIRRFFSSDPRITNDLLTDPLVRTRFDVHELRQCKEMTRSTVQMVGLVGVNTPVLVLQAVDDRQTPVSSIRIFQSKLRSKDQQIVLFSPRGHVLLQTSRLQPDVLKVVKDWLDKHTP